MNKKLTERLILKRVKAGGYPERNLTQDVERELKMAGVKYDRYAVSDEINSLIYKGIVRRTFNYVVTPSIGGYKGVNYINLVNSSHLGG